MLKMFLSAAAAAMVLTGLGSAVASADVPASSTKCQIPFEAAANVKVYGGAKPPQNKAELDKATVIGLLLKGKKACTDGLGANQKGANYKFNGDCAGKDDLWTPIRFNGATGWVPATCDVPGADVGGPDYSGGGFGDRSF
jgi:hypothetical protein